MSTKSYIADFAKPKPVPLSWMQTTGLQQAGLKTALNPVYDANGTRVLTKKAPRVEAIKNKEQVKRVKNAYKSRYENVKAQEADRAAVRAKIEGKGVEDVPDPTRKDWVTGALRSAAIGLGIGGVGILAHKLLKNKNAATTIVAKTSTGAKNAGAGLSKGLKNVSDDQLKAALIAAGGVGAVGLGVGAARAGRDNVSK